MKNLMKNIISDSLKNGGLVVEDKKKFATKRDITIAKWNTA